MGNAVLGRICLGADVQRPFLGFEIGDPHLDALLDRMSGKVFRNAGSDGTRDLRRIQFIGSRQQPVAMSLLRRAAPLAGVVELADHARPHIIAPVIQFFLELIFQNLALLFHHQNFFQPLRKVAHAFRFQRPGHADLVEPDTDIARDVFINAEIFQRLPRIQIRFAGGDNTDARARTIPDDFIELIDARIGQCRVPFIHVHPGFLLQHGIRLADVQTARWQLKIFRQDDLDAVRIDIDRHPGFDNIGHAFQ